MRRWFYSGQEVFVGDELRWEGATVNHDERRKTLMVKARENGNRSLAVRMRLTEVEATGMTKVGKERHRTFTGLDDGGAFTTLTIVKPDCGCGSS